MLGQAATGSDLLDLTRRYNGGAVVEWMRAHQSPQPLVGPASRLEALVLGSSDAIIFVEADGTISEWNPAAERMFGWTRAEAIGAPFSIVTPPDLETEISATLAAGTARPGTLTSALLRKDDSLFQAEITVSAVVDESGARGLVADIRDVTDRVLIEQATAAVSSHLDPAQALASFADVLRIAVPFSQFSVGVIDDDHYRRLVSVGRQSLFRWGERLPLAGNSAKVAVEEHRTIISSDTEQGTFDFDRRLARSGVRSYVILPLLSEGEVFATLNVGFPEPGAGTSEIVKLLESVAGAVTQGVKNILLYEREREAAERLREIDQLKSDFVAMVAHDLRSPVAGITGFASVLMEMWDRLDDAEKLRLARTIKRGADNIAGFIDDVLRVTQLESGEIDYQIAPFDLGDLVRRTVVELVPSDRVPRIRLAIEPSLPLAVGDERRVWQVLHNLVSNAVKFSPKNSPIDIAVARPNGDVRVAVHDRGPGIARHEIDLLFRKFSRLPSEKARGATGTGLGLFLAKKMVEAQGGRIWVESEPGLGSTFFFTVPCAADDA